MKPTQKPKPKPQSAQAVAQQANIDPRHLPIAERGGLIGVILGGGT